MGSVRVTMLSAAMLLLLCVGGASASAAREKTFASMSAMEAAANLHTSQQNELVEGEGEGIATVADTNDVGSFDPYEAWVKLEKYSASHPSFTSDALAWIITANVLCFIGFILFLVSEIRMVMTVRAQDTRMSLVEMKYMMPCEKLKEVAEEERRSVSARPYMTSLAILFFFVGTACFLIPFCDVLDIIGIPTGVSCLLIITLESLVCALCFAAFLLALVWSCTRPWAALVLLAISLMGDILCPTGNILLIGVWFGFAALLYGAYFHWLPESYMERVREGEGSMPSWLQSIGSLQVSFDPDEWGKVGKTLGDDTTKFFQDAGYSLQTLNPLNNGRERVLGKDGLIPEVGMRVRMSATMQEKGLGTVTEVHSSKKHCSVSWDLGGTDSLLYTDGKAEYLVLVETADTADKSANV
eukprot:CAMPEP_0181327182 /NCGR_PEP_ID=MMETSP1101-20121128/21946_1 /TAXON_ID=46948 /ORGANISM="Rhodomonas abbreviata, Strain Caron Lab Isolate" /LENGTH=412 /DNA_ID=CAMNT_0023435787 /DNA_START=8 /DNA_END=1246 /DNA_ORIENTATION=-